ncbi:MAG: cytochrome P450 [Anaerolineales bacterium]|nr:cytochrome P450 [Anaerolineales bacterium]
MTDLKPPYDLFTARFKADPFPTFAAMRRDDPIYAHRAPDGTTIWYVTRYEDVVAVLRDDVHFCKDPRHARAAAAPRRDNALQQLINENMLFADPPDHTRLRALVNQAFTPRRVEALAPRVQAITAELLDAVAARGAMDLIAAYALPLPVRVICELLGIPPADQAQVSDWSQAIISPGSRGLNYSARRRKVKAFVAYLQGMFADRAARPQDDLVTALVQAEEAGERLSEAELSSMVALLLVTGHETTVNLIGNGVLALLRHPAQRARLWAAPGLWETAVEELLRFDGPVETSTTRWVRQDVTLHGQRLRRGDVLRVVLSAANRDAAQFAAPDELDVARADNRHLAFGLGVHYCLGAPLARLEGRVALPALFGRFPNLRLAVPAEALRWRAGVLFRGLEALPVAWMGEGLAAD